MMHLLRHQQFEKIGKEIMSSRGQSTNPCVFEEIQGSTKKLVTKGDSKIAFKDKSLNSEKLKTGPLCLVKAVYSGISRGTELRKICRKDGKPNWNKKLRHFDEGSRLEKWSEFGYEMVGEIVEASHGYEHLVGKYCWCDKSHGTFSMLFADVAENYLIPESVDTEDLIRFTTTARTAIAMNAVHDADIILGENVLVVGAGLLGLLSAILARRSGANVWVADVNEAGRNDAQKAGFSTFDSYDSEQVDEIKASLLPEGFDKVIEASGTYSGLATAMKCIRKSGRVVTLGTYSGASCQLDLGREWSRNGLTLVSSMSVNDCSHRSHSSWSRQRIDMVALKLLAERQIDLRFLETTVVPFDAAIDHYRFLMNGGSGGLSILSYSR